MENIHFHIHYLLSHSLLYFIEVFIIKFSRFLIILIFFHIFQKKKNNENFNFAISFPLSNL